MKFSWLRLLPYFCAIAIFAGCESKFKITGVNVTITDFLPVKAVENQATMNLRFTNENIVPVAINGGTYSLFLNNTYVGKSVNEEAVGLAPMGTANKPVTITIENLALIRTLQSLGQANAIGYRLDSILKINVNDDHLNAKASSTGALDLTGLRPSAP